MKSLKGRGGVIGRGMSEKILSAMDELCFPTDHIDQHRELDGGLVKLDNEDFNKIKEWFKVPIPFACAEKLLSLDSGK